MKASRLRWARQQSAIEERLIHYAAPGLDDGRLRFPRVVHDPALPSDPCERARVQFERLFHRRDTENGATACQ